MLLYLYAKYQVIIFSIIFNTNHNVILFLNENMLKENSFQDNLHCKMQLNISL